MPTNGSGMSFTTGNVRVSLPPRSGSPGGLNEIRSRTAFRWKSISTDIRSEQSKANKFSVPIGYDSLYMYDPETLENDSGSNSYHHEYRVFNAAQVLPRYLVHFEVAALTEEADRERNALAKEAHHSLNGADVMGDILQLLDKKLHWSQESVRQKLNGVAALQTELTRHADGMTTLSHNQSGQTHRSRVASPRSSSNSNSSTLSCWK